MSKRSRKALARRVARIEIETARLQIGLALERSQRLLDALKGAAASQLAYAAMSAVTFSAGVGRRPPDDEPPAAAAAPVSPTPGDPPVSSVPKEREP